VPADRRLWNGLRAFFGFVAADRDGWAVLYRQARGREPFAGEVARMRDRMVDLVAGLLCTAGAADATPMAYALVGAGESLADWLVDHPDRGPDAALAALTAL